MTIVSNQQSLSRNLIQNSKCNQNQPPILLVLIASAFVISTIVLSNISEWLFLYRIIAFCFVFTYFLFIFFRKIEFIRPNAIHFIFIIWSIWGLIGSYDTLNLISMYVRFLTLLQLIFMAYLLFALTINTGSTAWLEWSCIIGVLISIAWIFLETGGNWGDHRISGPHGNPNVFAFALLFSLILSLKLLRDHSGIFIKSLLLLNMAIIFPFLLATGSRKGVIVFSVILAVATIHYLFFGPKKNRAKSIVIGFFLLLLTVTIFLPMLQESHVFKRLQNLERFAKGEGLVIRETSVSHRMDLYTRGFELALRNPLFGVGHDQFRYYDNSLRLGKVPYSYSHSNIIEVLANTGFFGFIIYHSMYAIIAIKLLSIWKKTNSESIRNSIYFVLLIGILIITYDFFSVTFYGKYYWIALTMVCSSLKMAQLSNRNSNFSQ